jgi:hypothetical protein
MGSQGSRIHSHCSTQKTYFPRTYPSIRLCVGSAIQLGSNTLSLEDTSTIRCRILHRPCIVYCDVPRSAILGGPTHLDPWAPILGFLRSRITCYGIDCPCSRSAHMDPWEAFRRTYSNNGFDIDSMSSSKNMSIHFHSSPNCQLTWLHPEKSIRH